VLHRDIKPANVLVFTSADGTIVWKLGDVGIAKVLQSTRRAGSVAGSIFYMARDVLDGPYDGKVDVFSTGIMAAELVVRYIDIAGFERVDATWYSLPEHRAALVEDACVRLDTVSPALSAVVRRCCAMMPADRIRSDAALLALTGTLGGGGHAAVSAPAAPLGSGAVPATSAVPAAPPTPPGAEAAAVQLIDMSDAADTVAALQVPADVLSRVCEAMTLVSVCVR
jgi:serine/threonine protein kinase